MAVVGGGLERCVDVADRYRVARDDPAGLPHDQRTGRVDDRVVTDEGTDPFGGRVDAQLGEGGEEVLGEVEGHQPTLATRLGPIKLVSACQRRGLSGVRWRRNSGASPNTATA